MYISCLLNITSAFFDVYYSPLSLIVLTFDAIHGFVEAAWLAVSVRANCNAVEMRTQAIMPKAQLELCNCPSSRPVCYLGYFLHPRFMG